MRILLVLIVVLQLVGCRSDGTDHPASHFTAEPTTKTLRGAGWTVTASKGGTVSKVKQTGFLKLRAPDGTKIDVQFIDSDAAASSEYAAAVKALDGFKGTVDHNTIIFLAPLGKGSPPPADVAALRSLLS